jgi:hypothetical protein
MQLDGLLDVDPDLGMTRLAWLRRGATVATPELLKAELDKLEFLRRHGAEHLDLSRLPVGRRRMLAEIGRRSTNQALQRAAVDRRHPVLLATLAETYVEVLDELVQLLDQALAGADSRARHELSQRLVDRAKAEVDRGRLLDEILDVLADTTVPDEQAGRVVRQRVGMQRLIAARRPAEDRGQRDHGHFDLLAARYRYLRTFTPVVIAALSLTGNTASPSVTALLAAVEVLRELNAAARTAVPDEATTAAATVFVGRRAGVATSTPRAVKAAAPPTAITGNWASCMRCRLGCAPATYGCPAHAATPIRPPCCYRRIGGPGSETTSAPSPAPTPARPRNWIDSSMSCTRQSRRWRRSWRIQAPRDSRVSVTTVS